MFQGALPQKIKTFVLSAHGLFFASAIVTWPVLAELEAFEALYEFSRDHEDYELDETIVLVFNLVVALILSLFVKSRRMKWLLAQQEEAHELAEATANHDALTGLLNRRAFGVSMQSSQRQMSENTPLCVAMIDLDRFKPVNDLRGHAVGDAVLTEVAIRLRHIVDDLGVVARLGGDEFAVLFKQDLSATEIERAARRIVHGMQERFVVDQVGVSIGCSVGLALWTHDVAPSEALRRADTALYRAKSEGRGRLSWYDADLDDLSTARAEMELALREAVRHGDVQPWFQPIVDISTGELVGFEVLARWHHAELVAIPPGYFIELAEDCGMISELGQGIISKALVAACRWPEHLSISVNVSPLQFLDAHFVETIRVLLQECAFPAERLTVEVTESSVIADFDTASEKLEALKALGVKIALDDFGTGYSSLASLRNLPFDRVKIDQSFVRDITHHPKNQKIVSIIMDLAEGFEIDVTIEGIETPEELGYLGAEAGGLGQGYLFGRAVPPDEVTWRLESEWGDPNWYMARKKDEPGAQSA